MHTIAMQEKDALISPLLSMLSEIKILSEELQTALLKSFLQQGSKKRHHAAAWRNFCKNLWFLARGFHNKLF